MSAGCLHGMDFRATLIGKDGGVKAALGPRRFRSNELFACDRCDADAPPGDVGRVAGSGSHAPPLFKCPQLAQTALFCVYTRLR
jgi:hypothetical protein